MNSMGLNSIIVNPVKYAAITASAAGDNQVVTAVTNRKIRGLAYSMVADAAEVVQWQDDGGATMSGTISLAANGGVVSDSAPDVGLFQSAVGQGIDLNNVGGADVDGHFTYLEV